MNHKGTKTLETARLALRPFRPDDAAPAYRNWMSDTAVTEFLRWPAHTDPAVSERVIRDWVDAYSSPNFYQWAIVWKEIGEPIGSISVVGQNETVDSLHIGYCIGSPWWHRGIASEALDAVISYLFTTVGAKRIEAQHDPENPHSGNVMQKCGMRYEGTLRQADISNRGIVDACMYSILRNEWQNAHR